MGMVWTPNGPYGRIGYASEADLETALLRGSGQLFGQQRIYLDAKKKIGQKGGRRHSAETNRAVRGRRIHASNRGAPG